MLDIRRFMLPAAYLVGEDKEHLNKMRVDILLTHHFLLTQPSRHCAASRVGLERHWCPLFYLQTCSSVPSLIWSGPLARRIEDHITFASKVFFILPSGILSYPSLVRPTTDHSGARRVREGAENRSRTHAVLEKAFDVEIGNCR